MSIFPPRPLRPALVMLLALPLASCGDDPVDPQAPAAVDLVSGNEQVATAGAALMDSVVVRVVDDEQQPVPGVSVRWTVTNGGGSIAPAMAETGSGGTVAARWTLGTTAGPNSVTAQVGELPAVTFSATGVAGPPAFVRAVGGADLVGTVGFPLQDSLVVRVEDLNRNVVDGATVTWRVEAGGGAITPGQTVTTPDGLTRAEWTLGTTAGPNEVRATAGFMGAATFDATAEAGAVALLEVIPSDTTLPLGHSHSLGIAAEDSHGNVVEAPEVAWSSTNEAVATVDASGLVTARLEGTAEIVASAGSVNAAVSLTVGPPPALAIESDSIELRATRESSAAMVASGGVPPIEWSVAAGVMPTGVSLTPAGAINGIPSGAGSQAVTVRATDARGTVATREVRIQVCDAPADLEVGEAIVWSFPNPCGVMLPESEGATYRVGVTALAYRSTGREAEAVDGGLRLERSADGPDLIAVRSEEFDPKPRVQDDAFDKETRALMRRTEALHARLREEEIRRFGDAPSAPLGPPSRLLKQQAANADAADERSFFVIDPTGNNRIQIAATLRAESDDIIYYQDASVAGTADEATDTEIQAALLYYAAHGKPIIDDVFGGLGPDGTTDSFLGGPRSTRDLDGNGKLIVVQLSADHMLEGAAGYVSSCDRYPLRENYNAGPYYCSGSNEAEIMYILRPSSDYYLGTVVHEAKHISSHGYAIFGGRGYNPSWIEEGTADIAKELSSRLAAGFGFQEELIFDDLYPRPGAPPATTYGMATVHARARAFLQAAPVNALIGNPDPNTNNSTYYGSSWLFHRYLADTYAGVEVADFFRGMNTGGAGTAEIERATGRSFSDLVAEFTLAIAVEGADAARQAATYRFSSYDFAGIATRFAGGEWPYILGSASFSDGSTSLSTYYTATNFFDLSGDGGIAQRLDLLTIDGAPLLGSTEGVLTITRLR